MSGILWIDAGTALPKDGEVVLIYTDENHVRDREGHPIRAHVAMFCQGRTAAVVEATGRQGWADQKGNNLVPFRWDSVAGPGDWYGQRVTHWARIEPPTATDEPSDALHPDRDFLDCGDSTCLSPERVRGGMRTNSGCHCFLEDLARAHERRAKQIRAWPYYERSERDRLICLKNAGAVDQGGA